MWGPKLLGCGTVGLAVKQFQTLRNLHYRYFRKTNFRIGDKELVLNLTFLEGVGVEAADSGEASTSSPI